MQVESKGSVWEIVAMALATLSLVLVIVNAGLVLRNQSLQLEVGERQQIINQGTQFARLRQLLAQSVANIAAAKKDAQLNELLTRHGITPAGAASTPAPAAATESQGK